MYRVVPGKTWLRRIYGTYFGLCRGIIDFEDLSPGLNPVPVAAGSHSISGEGIWEAPADGEYSFSITSQDIDQVWVDGRRVLDYKSADLTLQKHSCFLQKGPHRILYKAYLRTLLRFADVEIRNKELNYVQHLE
jgi:hypothetical protein